MKPVFTALFILSSTWLSAQPGALDMTFGDNGTVETLYGQCVKSHAVAIDASGKVLVAGSYRTDPNSYSRNIILIRYESDGSLDNTFGSGGIVTADLGDDDEITSILIQPDGKILIAGYTGSSVDYDDVVLIRFNNDGSFDPTFGDNGVVNISFSNANDRVLSAALQATGEIVVAGTLYNGFNDDCFIARFNDDGSLDNSFGTNGLVQIDIDNENQQGESVAITEDGAILLGGYTYESQSANFLLARFTSQGDPDLSFGADGKSITDLGGDDHAYSMVIQPDNKILLSGTTFLNFNSDVALVRYNTDGSLDNSFGASGIVTENVAGPEDDSRSIQIQQDGKILVAGSARFTMNTDFILLRFNIDGSPDLTFDDDGLVTTDFNSASDYAFASVLGANQKIILVGASDVSIALAQYQSSVATGASDFGLLQHPALIYPNPITSEAVLDYSLESDEMITLNLYDQAGKLSQRFFEKQKRVKGIHHEVLKINPSLVSGNYFVSIEHGSQRFQLQIAKQ